VPAVLPSVDTSECAWAYRIVARRFAAAYGFLPHSRRLDTLLAALSLERGLMIALGIAGAGLAGVGWSLWRWALADFGELTEPAVMRVLTFALVLVAIGVQLAFAVFLLGIVDLPRRGKETVA
jgi:hypothetical protein